MHHVVNAVGNMMLLLVYLHNDEPLLYNLSTHIMF